MSDTTASEAEADTTQIYPSQDWYFTFGHGQPHFGTFVSIYGSFREARAEMFKRFGPTWCMQYESAEAAGVTRWSLTHLGHYIAPKEVK